MYVEFGSSLEKEHVPYLKGFFLYCVIELFLQSCDRCTKFLVLWYVLWEQINFDLDLFSRFIHLRNNIAILL